MSADNWTDCPVCKAEDQLREDYQIYIDEDKAVMVHYVCGCTICEFEFSFDHKALFDFNKSELKIAKIATEKRKGIDKLERQKQDLERQKQAIEKQLQELLNPTPDSPAGRRAEEV